MKTYLELEAANKALTKLLQCAMDNAMHSPECACNLTPPVSFEKDMEICTCWCKDADRSLRPEAYAVEKPGVYLGINDGPPCGCKHVAGAHSHGGIGLCSREGCMCMKYNGT